MTAGIGERCPLGHHWQGLSEVLASVTVALVLARARSTRRGDRRRWALCIGVLGALTLSGLVLASCGSSSPKSSTGTGLTTPVIKENFTRLPCNHSNTLGLEGCAETQLLEADHRIDREVKLLFYSSPPIKRRSSSRPKASSSRIGATPVRRTAASMKEAAFAPVEYALCEVRVDNVQSSVLHGYFQLAESGADHSLQWPSGPTGEQSEKALGQGVVAGAPSHGDCPRHRQ